MRIRFLAIVSVATLIILSSCAKEPKDEPLVIEEVLPGYWELSDATRNEKPVSSLEGTYFEFDSLGTVSTNFAGEQVVSEYELLDSAITYENAGKTTQFDYQIKHADTLVLSTVMRNIFKFELTLFRAEKK